ncbi:polysaccharide pyruvyl transferase family protein [Pyrococcus kukulkanii]|uniref:polysaccharide pyruvyl transferase family protein n=1 Tax=Pyrococcus kukulkanii TaxID=1609559 RepID=UPI0035613BFB
MKTITYFSSSWFENIGNAFIDIGTKLLLKKTIQGSEYRLIETSMYPCIASSFSTPLKGVFKLFWRFYGEQLGLPFLEKRISYLKTCDSFNLAHYITTDIFVISGCILTPSFFRIYGEILKKLKKKGVKFIFCGAGGNTYSETEIEHVSKWLDELQPYALITRDSIAFRNYRDFAEKSFDGIDCAFFVNYLPHIKGINFDFSPYVVLTFDKFRNKKVEKKIEQELKQAYHIIKTTHVPHPEKTIFPVPKKEKNMTLISENPYDYLLLYANAEKVYSDRIHACVVSLAFGVPCRLYTKSPRVAMFSKVARDSNGYMVPTKELDKYRIRQETFLIDIISDIF